MKKVLAVLKDFFTKNIGLKILAVVMAVFVVVIINV